LGAPVSAFKMNFRQYDSHQFTVHRARKGCILTVSVSVWPQPKDELSGNITDIINNCSLFT